MIRRTMQNEKKTSEIYLRILLKGLICVIGWRGESDEYVELAFDNIEGICFAT